MLGLDHPQASKISSYCTNSYQVASPRRSLGTLPQLQKLFMKQKHTASLSKRLLLSIGKLSNTSAMPTSNV